MNNVIELNQNELAAVSGGGLSSFIASGMGLGGLVGTAACFKALSATGVVTEALVTNTALTTIVAGVGLGAASVVVPLVIAGGVVGALTYGAIKLASNIKLPDVESQTQGIDMSSHLLPMYPSSI